MLTGTDLSAGRVVGITAALSASLLQTADAANKFFESLGEPGVPMVLLIMLLAVVVGGFVGLVNGFFVARFQLHPFIVTLATQMIVYGLCLVYYNNRYTYRASPSPACLRHTANFVTGSILPKFGTLTIPNYVLYAVVVFIISGLSGTRPRSARTCSPWAPTPRRPTSPASTCSSPPCWCTRWPASPRLCGLHRGGAHLLELANTGTNYESDAIAACVIAGVSFVGGTGTVGGVLLGVVLLRIIFVCLQYLSVDQNLQYIIKGVIILLACSIDMRKYLTRK